MNKLTHKVLEFAESIGLIIISISALVAFGFEISSMMSAGVVTLADILLMFIYLEVLSMVSVYIKSGKLPIRMPLYIAIVALARYLILDMKSLNTLQMLGIGGTVLLIAIAILIVRYGHCVYSYSENE